MALPPAQMVFALVTQSGERLRDKPIVCLRARLEWRQSLNNKIITIALVFKRVSIYKAKRVNK